MAGYHSPSMNREQSLFPQLGGVEPVSPGAGASLHRSGRLCDYYDWPALRSTRSARRWAQAMSSVTDLAFLPFILVAPSVGFTVWIGGRAATAAMQRAFHRRRRVVARIERERHLARAVPVCEVQGLEPGTSVRVRGKIRPRTRLQSTLSPACPVAYEWLLVREERLPERAFFVERGHDFDIADETGATLRVSIARARIVAEWYPDARRLGLDVATDVRAAIPQSLTGRRQLALNSLAASDVLLAEDSDVEVFGFVNRAVDPSAPALPRDIPTRCVLTSCGDSPLIVMPERALAR